MEYVTIIPAAGSSIRFKKDKLKTKINGDSILNFSIDVFIEDADCKKIILVVKKDQFDYYKSLYRLVNKIVVFGVNTMSRSETVYQGLNQLLKHEYVMIHDACRPYLTAKLVNEIKNEIDSNNYDAVIPVIPIVDSVIQQNNNEIIYPPRETLKRVQTPQCFKVQILKNSFEANTNNELFNDEFSLVLKNNPLIKYKLINGELRNKKITYPDDINEIDFDNN